MYTPITKKVLNGIVATIIAKSQKDFVERNGAPCVELKDCEGLDRHFNGKRCRTPLAGVLST